MHKKYNVVALVRMEKVRASQLLPLRKKLLGEVEILSIKDKIAKKAFEKLDVSGIKELKEKLTGQCLFMFTNMSPFKLNVLLGKNKIMLAARGGDIASIDVIVPPKNTGIAPGPMLTEFKENKIPTKIDQGTIWILKETTPVKKGEVISTKLAALLAKLDIKPIEARIVLNSALSESVLFNEEELTVDVEKFREKLIQAAQEAKSLSIEIAYITPENAEQLISKASQSARSLSIESGFLTDETKEQILQKAHGQAQNISSKLPAEATTDDAPAEKADVEPKADAPAEKADVEPKADAPAEKAD
ncbi:50S ribosomal protein L10, partial [Marine Group I thaumarchaeote SCGC AAA799-D07]